MNTIRKSFIVMVCATALLRHSITALRSIPRRLRRLYWSGRLAALGYRPVSGGALTDVTDGSRVVQQGIGKCEVVLSEAVLPGDLLGQSASTWVKADANNSVYAELIAGQKGASGDTITAYRIARVSAVSGAAIGDAVYLSDTAGGLSATAGTVGQLVGICLSATEVLLFPTYTSGGQLIAAALKVFFRDSGIYIHSSADGKLTISADGSGADDITLDGAVTVNDNITMADAKNIIANATTGTKIGTATSQKLGFFNAAPVTQPGAYTQTYATADKTHANPTQNTITAVANVDGASANNEFQDSAGANPSQAEWRVLSKTLKEELNAIKADIADVKQVANSIIDDLQSLGLVG